MASEDQIRANRENAKRSEGARTPETKKVCSMNAVKHGLTARTIVLPHEQVAEYNQCVAIVFNQYKPATDMEKLVIQEVADNTWKLQRVAVYESGLHAKGRLENQARFQEVEDPEERHIIVEAEIQHTYSKTFTNLSLQQGKTQSHLEKKIKQFEKLRAERELIELAKRKIAMESVKGDQKDMRPAHHTVGSVFSLEYLANRIVFIKAVGERNVLIFDRAWGDLKAKTPA